MKKEARLVLENVIAQLDKDSGAPVKDGSFRAQAEKLDPKDAESFKQFYIATQLLLESMSAHESAVARVVIGENILTPSLTTRGWKFWKEPLLTESEKKAAESAFMRYAEAERSQAQSVKKSFDKLPNKDQHASLIGLASLLDVLRTCMQQLSADLKHVLHGSEDE